MPGWPRSQALTHSTSKRHKSTYSEIVSLGCRTRCLVDNMFISLGWFTARVGACPFYNHLWSLIGRVTCVHDALDRAYWCRGAPLTPTTALYAGDAAKKDVCSAKSTSSKRPTSWTTGQVQRSLSDNTSPARPLTLFTSGGICWSRCWGGVTEKESGGQAPTLQSFEIG